MKSSANDNSEKQWSDGDIKGVAFTVVAVLVVFFWAGICWMLTEML